MGEVWGRGLPAGILGLIFRLGGKEAELAAQIHFDDGF